MAKNTGIVRKVDELGRVVIPIEVRRTLGIHKKDALEIYIDGEHIVLKKHEPHMACMMTGEVNEDNLVLNNGKLVLSPEAVRQMMPQLKDYLKQHPDE